MYKNKKIAVIIAAAGSGNRMGSGIPKQFMNLGGKLIVTRAVEAFSKNAFIDEIYVVTSKDYVAFCENELIERAGLQKIKEVLVGGKQRQDSIYQALKILEPDTEYVLVHDSARPFVTDETIRSLIESAYENEAAVVAVPTKDTIKASKENVVIETLDRTILYSVQTPQGFQKDLLLEAYQKAYEQDFYGTDDGVLVEKLGKKVYLVKGDYNNIKITTKEDLAVGEVILSEKLTSKMEAIDMRIGTGFDVHQLVEGRKLILGGIEIPFEKGLLGHSDADVLIHAVMDALLGAGALGNIGTHFPDSDNNFKGISSLILLKKVGEILQSKGYQIGNIDVTVIAERPKIAPYINDMIMEMANILKINQNRISIKGTTTEKLGFCGREEGIAAQASVLIRRR